MESSIAVVSAAMAAPNGLDSVTLSDSVWAGVRMISKPSVSGLRFDPLTLGTIPDDCFPEVKPEKGGGQDLTALEIRLVGLACLVRSEVGAPGFSGAAPSHVIVGLPANLPAPEKLLNLMVHHLGLGTSPATVLARGRAAGLMGVHEACRLIDSGKAVTVIAGGVDSYNDTDRLGMLHGRSRVKTAAGMDQFIPGEGACLVCLMAEQAARRLGVEYHARILSSAVGMEPGHLYSGNPCRGTGLSETFRALLSRAKDRPGPVRTVFSSMNGESFWAREWGVAFVRNAGMFHHRMVLMHPAETHGDPGAASGPLMIGYALRGYEHGYLEGPALVYASSDTGDRAAVLMEGVP